MNVLERKKLKSWNYWVSEFFVWQKSTYVLNKPKRNISEKNDNRNLQSA